MKRQKALGGSSEISRSENANAGMQHFDVQAQNFDVQARNFDVQARKAELNPIMAIEPEGLNPIGDGE